MLKNGVLTNFQNWNVGAQKGGTTSCPFKNPKKNVKMVVLFDLWPLSSFHPFPSLKKGVAKNTCFIIFVATPFLQSSTNIHEQPPEQKIEEGDGYHPLFERPVFGPRHQKATKTLHPSLKT